MHGVLAGWQPFREGFIVSFDSAGRLLTLSDKPIYMIYWDSYGVSGYSFDVNISTDTSDDLEPNDTCAAAQTLGAGVSMLRNLSLRNQGDEDWFVITFDAWADIRRCLNAWTSNAELHFASF